VQKLIQPPQSYSPIMLFKIWPLGKKDNFKKENEIEDMQSSCPKCGAEISKSSVTCLSCGETLQEPFDEKSKNKSLKRSLLLFARDLAVAFLIVGIIIAGIYAYTRVWPPMVVVESSSMQHGNAESYIGVIDTGDLVLVQSTPYRQDVITWVEGKKSGYRTYSGYGDVIIFRKDNSDTPIIHRPLVWMDYDDVNGTFDIPDLADLNRSFWGGTYANNTPVTTPYKLDGTIWLLQVGWTETLRVEIRMADFAGFQRSGYVTMGDNNFQVDFDNIVRQTDIIGKARGELPWFGLIKLTLMPSPGSCCNGWGDSRAPSNSWDSLIISLVVIIATPFILDISFSLFLKWKEAKGKKRKSPKSQIKETTVSPTPSEETDKTSESTMAKESSDENLNRRID